MNHLEIIKYVEKNKHKKTYTQVAIHFNVTPNAVRGIIGRARIQDLIVKEKGGIRSFKKELIMKAVKRTKPSVGLIPKPPNTKNVLVIGDLHEPFTLNGYRQFCVAMYKKWQCTHVVFIGDIIDNHFASFHTTDPDGMGAGGELDLAIKRIGLWVKAFPKADVIIGNHDRLIMRKAFEGGIPTRWIRDYQDVLDAPNWNFTEERSYDGVHYIHGEGATARTRCRRDLMSTVQGHRHTEAYSEYTVGQTYRIFGMQVGCGVDRKSYAMAYAKNFPKPSISVGLVLEHGSLAVVEMMHL